MVKYLIRILFMTGLGLLAVTACAPAAAPSPPQSSGVVGDEGGLYPLQDLSLVAATGRPQFLHSYADW